MYQGTRIATETLPYDALVLQNSLEDLLAGDASDATLTQTGRAGGSVAADDVTAVSTERAVDLFPLVHLKGPGVVHVPACLEG